MTVPGGPDGLTADFINAALGDATGDAKIIAVNATEIGAGLGFVGRSFRCDLQYERPSTGPASVIAKLPTIDAGLRRVFADFALYEREVRFYRELRDGVPVLTPLCHFAEVDDSGDFVLVLEDLAPAAPGDPIAGCSVEDARRAIDLIAKMHVAWWDDPRLDSLEWLPGADAPRILRGIESDYRAAWDGFTRRAGKGFPRPVLRLGEAFCTQLPWVLARLSSAPKTLVHGDYQMANVFYDSPGNIRAVIDWQVIIQARGAMDIAHFIARSLTPEDRKASERELVRHYHDALVTAGVRGYAFGECWDDYRLAVASQFGLGILLSHGLAATAASREPDAARDAFSAVVGARLIQALADLRPEELLERKPFWRRFPLQTRG